MSVVSSVVESALNTALTVGTAALHTLSPDNYEYYMCSLELLNADGDQEGFMSFVVMPNNLSETTTPIQSQTKTKNGFVTLINGSFAPVTINLQGTFGRKFRLVTDIIDPNSSSKDFFNGNIGKLLGSTVSIKSGYGLTRVLQYILKAANELDKNGRPRILLFNNWAFNTAYVVDVMSYSFSQSTENNMLWFYQVQLKGIAPADSIQKTSQSNGNMLSSIKSNAIAQGLSNIISSVTRTASWSYI